MHRGRIHAGHGRQESQLQRARRTANAVPRDDREPQMRNVHLCRRQQDVLNCTSTGKPRRLGQRTDPPAVRHVRTDGRGDDRDRGRRRTGEPIWEVVAVAQQARPCRANKRHASARGRLRGCAGHLPEGRARTCIRSPCGPNKLRNSTASGPALAHASGVRVLNSAASPAVRTRSCSPRTSRSRPART
jgi:hypothetical protein